MDEHILKSFNGGGDKKHYLSTMSAQDMSPKEGFETTNLFSYDYRTQHVGGNTCRGLLYFNFDDQIVLCNLRTKELKFVAPPKKPIPSHTWFNGCGLGYDSKSGDYKLIRNYYRWSCCNGGDDEDEDSEYFYQHRCGPHEEKTELYSLKSDSWKEIPTPDAYIDLIHMCGVYVEGSCYWPARQGSAFGGRRSREDVCDILSFDFTDESFSWIPSPISDYRFEYDLVECRGFLGAIAYENTYGSPKCGVNSFELSVWKERSWAKSFVVAVYGIEKPLGLIDGRFLFLKRKRVDQLLVYDYITKEMKKPDIDAHAQNVSVVSYVENRVVLHCLIFHIRKDFLRKIRAGCLLRDDCSFWWRSVQVKDALIQSGLHKALKGRPGAVKKPGADDDANNKSGMSDEDWEDLDLKAASTIRLCLAKNVLANVHGISSAKELWEKLEALYQAKGISNRLYLKEQFHTLRMDEGVKISDHLSILNGIISELESIGAKIEDEDKALRLILSLPRSYEHMKPILVYGKETLVFAEVTGKLLLEERRLMSEGRTSSENSAMVAFSRGRKKDSKGVVCWRCGKPGHTKRNCPGGACRGGADSAESSEQAANIVFDDVL
ncbi:uncharacterized protein LOC131013372 [Salvia miltiorrhiza]|uniref:uncharacterized protein LOC131013372 n=1 Tax=Salvia miltiorrhiza TaxID=226208 RepID=UPI0025ABDAAB|nr:uncharacterized protein LOC131013372 [Salvia miltiorrhiza]